MKLTTREALERLAAQTLAEAPPPPPAAAVWLRGEYLRREARRTRRQRLNVLVPAAVTGIGLLGLAAWNGTWLRADALSQLGGFLTRGGSAFSGALPAAVVGLVLVVTAALDAAARPAPRP